MKFSNKIFVAVLPLIFLLSLIMLSFVAADSWPTFMHDVNHTGYSSDSINLTNFGLVWSRYSQYHEPFVRELQPIISGDSIYLGEGLYPYLTKINSTNGNYLWNYSLYNPGANFGVAASDEYIYFGPGNCTFYALNRSNGNLLWKSILVDNPTEALCGGHIHPTLFGDKIALGFTFDSVGKLSYLNATNGTVLWTVDTSDSSPILSEEFVYILDSKLRALNASTGAQIWNSSQSSGDHTTASYYNGLIYYASLFGGIGAGYAFNSSNGENVWNNTIFSSGESFHSTPSIYPGIIYLISSGELHGENFTFALNASTGAQIWNFSNSAKFVWTDADLTYSSPVVSSNGIVFVIGTDFVLYGLNYSNGDILLNYSLPSRVMARSPVSGISIANNILFVTSQYDLYALSGDQFPIITQNSPEDSYSTDIGNLTFNCSIRDGTGDLSNISLYITDSNNESFSLNQTTNISEIENNSVWSVYLSEGNYTWNCLGYDVAGNYDWGQNRSIRVNAVYPLFSSFWDNNGTLNDVSNGAEFNVTIENTNGVVYLWINGGQYPATNISNKYHFGPFTLTPGTYSYNWSAQGNGTNHNLNWSDNFLFTTGTYPKFSNYWDNNGTITGYGIAQFNITVTNTNGTVIFHLEDDDRELLASNLTYNVYNVSLLLSNGTYLYNWSSYGNGTGHNFNLSENREYTVLDDNVYPVFSNYADTNGSLTGGGMAEFNVSVQDTNGSVFLNINNRQYSAVNSTLNNYRAFVFLPNGTLSYNWSAYGNGSTISLNNSLNYSAQRSYTVLNYSSVQVDSWPNFGYDQESSRYNPISGINLTYFGVLWNSTIGASSYPSPVISGGILYVSGRDGDFPRIYAINSTTGIQLWNFSTLAAGYSSVKNVFVYTSCYGGVCVLNSSTGTNIMNFSTWPTSSGKPVVSDNNLVYTIDGYAVYTFDSLTGNQIWNYTASTYISTPTIYDNFVYFGETQGSSIFYALNAFTGALNWTYDFPDTGGVVGSSVSKNIVYVSAGAVFFALNSSTGAQIWNSSGILSSTSSPALMNDSVFIGGGNETLYSLNATNGTQIWNFTCPRNPGDENYDLASPSVANGVVFVGCINNKSFFALNSSSGVSLYNYTASSYFSSPASVAKGIVYIVDGAGKIYAFTNLSEDSTDRIYPVFSNYGDNNASLTGSGIARFNVTVTNTNGTVTLNINGSSYSATNLTSNVYNVSFSFGNGTYVYNWSAYGNGTSHNTNLSGNRFYTINNPLSCTDSDSDGFNVSKLGCGTPDCDDSNANIKPPSDGMTLSANTIFCNGTYYVNDTNGDGKIITLANGGNLTCNSTIMIGNSSGIAFNLNSGTASNVTNCHISNYSDGIDLGGRSNCVIENNIIKNIKEKAIRLKGGAISNLIKNNIINNSGEVGILIDESSFGNIILNNTIITGRSCTKSAIVIDRSSNDTQIINNTLKVSGTDLDCIEVASTGGSKSVNLTISGNYLENCSRYGISVSDTNGFNISIINNIINLTGNSGLYIAGTLTGINVTGNRILYSGSTSSSVGKYYASNQYWNSSGTLFDMSASQTAFLSTNVLTGGSSCYINSDGADLSGCEWINGTSNLSVFLNDVTPTGLSDKNFTIIMNGNFDSCSDVNAWWTSQSISPPPCYYACRLYIANGVNQSYTLNTACFGNSTVNITRSLIFPPYVTYSSSNPGYYGIKITGSGVSVYNNYLNNSYNVYDSGTNNWNTTKTLRTNIIGGSNIGGNFYSDYNGTDTDGDGIGNTNYNILGGTNKDFLPLTDNQNISDINYPIFSNYYDNNASLVTSGTALFNVTITTTNGTVLLNINGSSYSATNLTANMYNVSISLSSGTYSYNWSAYGNGTNHNLNYSSQRSYTVLSDALPPNISIHSPTNTTYTASTIKFNVSTNEVATCNYSLNSGINLTMFASGSNTSFYAFQDLTNGNYNVSFLCTDSNNNINNTENVSFIVDVCTPDCSAASSHCSGTTFDDGCGGSCSGTKSCGGGGGGGGCIPSCLGKQCGSDGCGGSCGSCAVEFTCSSGICVSNCQSSWTCGSWTECIANEQSRICTDSCTHGTRVEQQTCSCGSTTCTWTTCAQGDEYSYPYNCVNDCGDSSDTPEARRCGVIITPPDIITDGEKGGENTPAKKGNQMGGPSCTSWGVCEADYSLTDILNENYDFKGLQKRTCKSGNSSVMESKPCDLGVNIKVEKKERCFETYFEIYDLSNNTLIGRIKKSSINDYSNNTRVDISFPIQEISDVCEHCFDGIKNYDEGDVDCGGQDCEKCVPAGSFFNWLFYLIIFLWACFVGSFVYFSKVMRIVGDSSEGRILFRGLGRNTPVEDRIERRIGRFFRKKDDLAFVRKIPKQDYSNSGYKPLSRFERFLQNRRLRKIESKFHKK